MTSTGIPVVDKRGVIVFRRSARFNVFVGTIYTTVVTKKDLVMTESGKVRVFKDVLGERCCELTKLIDGEPAFIPVSAIIRNKK